MATKKGPELGLKITQDNISAVLGKRSRISENFIQAFLVFSAAVSILTTLGIVWSLSTEALRFFMSPEVNIWEFFTGTTWQPQIGEFGILPLLNATLVTSVIAMVIAGPLGIAVAIYLSEYAPKKVSGVLKPILEVLAGVPTIVYGFFALSFVTPALQDFFGRDLVNVYNNMSAGLVMGVLILPTVASMSEDALSAVPKALKQGGFAMGATKLEVALNITVPAAISGIIASVILGLSRAIGETMIVALAAGAGPNLSFNPFDSAETMTGHIVRISGGDLSYDSIDYNSLFAIALVLFVTTLILNMVSRQIIKRFREVYE
ncbi:MAG: phosphate ABC transporter permease subunit PstC [Spirochaetes bacterium GWB1_48_6]|nr:MAG: phosphate ABC transporter permease subunit PstC [Spirochaetes bacterium GWB1_48_6]